MPTKRVPRVEVSSVHRAAGAKNGDRREPWKSMLLASWKSTDKAVKQSARDARKRGNHWVHVTDANASMDAKDFHPDARLLFADKPDYGVVVAAPGWKVEDVKRDDETIGLEGMHRAHRITITFVEGGRDGRRQTITVTYGNLGRASSVARARDAWENFREAVDQSDVVCPIEVQEGDDYNERKILRDVFSNKRWKRYYLRTSRNPILVRRRTDVQRHSSRVVGKPVPHWSPPRRLNRVVVSVPAK